MQRPCLRVATGLTQKRIHGVQSMGSTTAAHLKKTREPTRPRTDRQTRVLNCVEATRSVYQSARTTPKIDRTTHRMRVHACRRPHAMETKQHAAAVAVPDPVAVVVAVEL